MAASYVRRQQKSISEVLTAAVDCLPPELVRLTADYLIEQPHSWTAFEAGPIPTGTTNSIDFRTDAEDERIVRLIAANIGKTSWRTMVSAQPLATAHLDWTIDFTSDGTVEAAVGVTLLPSNRYVADGSFYISMAFATDWIFYPDYYPTVRKLVFVHNQERREFPQRLLRLPRFMPYKYRFRFVFTADPIERIVTAQMFQAFEADELQKVGAPVQLLTAESPAVFAALRPCVVFNGDVGEVVVRSGRLDDD